MTPGIEIFVTQIINICFTIDYLTKMKTQEIKSLFIKFENAASEYEGIECWSARELKYF